MLRVALVSMAISIATARNLALGPEQITVVQSARHSRLHTRENAITWASVGWAGRNLAWEATGEITGKENHLLSLYVLLVKIFDASKRRAVPYGLLFRQS